MKKRLGFEFRIDAYKLNFYDIQRIKNLVRKYTSQIVQIDFTGSTSWNRIFNSVYCNKISICMARN